MTTALNITFRKASRHDVDNLVALEKSSFPKKIYGSARLSAKDFRDYLTDSDYELTVAELDKKILGYYLLDVAQDDPSSANLDSMAVTQEFRKQGVGALLLREAEEVCKRHGFPAITLEVHEGNLRAYNLYNKMGYIEVERSPNYYDDDAAAIEMEKPLL